MTPEFLQLAFLMLIAAALGIFVRLLRQPVVLAYLAAGAAAGWFGFFHLADTEIFRVFADLGIMFLLFLVGLEINYTSLRMVGRISVILGVAQVAFTAAIGYGIAALFGFAAVPALYLAIALTFSSTIVVVKLLSEKRDLQSLYGKISVGMLLVQDVIAIVILVVLAGFGSGGTVRAVDIATVLAKATALFTLMLWLGRSILPRVFDRIAREEELLFLVSLAWVFLLATVVSWIGFSIEIAGFLAGLALANSAEHYQIANRIRSLRDFFILVFFVILGSSLILADMSGILVPVFVFSAFVLIGNPLIVFLIMASMGYRARTSFLTGLTVAQVSEFSLVLAALGIRLGHITGDVGAIVTGVAVITITLSAYLVGRGDAWYRRLAPFLRRFERRALKEDGRGESMPAALFILIGAHRVGRHIAKHLPPDDTIIIDFDPEVIADLVRRDVPHVFGDIADPEIFDRVDFGGARLVISTSPDLDDNLLILERLKNLPPRPDGGRPRAVLRAETEREAEILYDAGADYVLLPPFTAGQYLGKTITIDPEFKILDNLRASDLATIKTRE